jgi:hypothetical protein
VGVAEAAVVDETAVSSAAVAKMVQTEDFIRVQGKEIKSESS